MKISVMGAGSVGGYFGGMLARGGNQVTLIARGEHLANILQHGLHMDTSQGAFKLDCWADIAATNDPSSVGPMDLILFTVKTYHNQQAIEAMIPMAGPDTVILCLQNGVDSYQAVAESLGTEKVIPGCAYIEAGIRYRRGVE
jgi:2-dehydropantoate 2-reductase